MDFITQPFNAVRLGEYLITHLSDPQWSVFRAAIAFVKRSGTQYLRLPLQEFSNRAQVRISVGVDLNGTSREGLLDLLEATPGGEVWIYRNNGPYTFHPKVYLFKSNQRADLIVGSGNLTGGGLFTNYEASLAASLDLEDSEDVSFVQTVEATLDSWSQGQEGICYLLTQEFLEQLVTAGLVRTEAQLAALQQANLARAQQPQLPATTAGATQPTTPAIAPLFTYLAVPPPPAIALPAARAPEPEPEPIEVPPPVVLALTQPEVAPVQVGGVSSYVITLQQTDVGFGQTTAGTSPRSPEVFVPLAALDQNPPFWGFPDQFTPDNAWNARYPNYRRNGLGKMDRIGVPMRVGLLRPVNMFFNPRKKDLRLRNRYLRSSGSPGDIILVRRVDPSNGFEYDIQVAPQGSPLYKQLLPYCNTPVRNSQKMFGYF